MEIKLDKYQQEVYEFVENTDKNVFIQGQAGTGKSYWINYLRKHTNKNICIAAPTASATLDICGTTIHKLFRLAPMDIFDKNKFRKSRNKTNDAVLRTMTLLVIDEVSMLRPDILDVINVTLQDVKQNKLPFGGVQVVLIGDLYQLPTIIKTSIKEAFKTLYGSEKPHFFDSKAYIKGKFKQFEFKAVYRQHDEILQKHLVNIRSGKNLTEAVKYFNDQKDLKRKDFENAVIITPKRDKVNEINSNKLREIPDLPRTFTAICKGSFEGANDTPSPVDLTLKVNAQVIFTKNDTLDKKDFIQMHENDEYDTHRERWVNGTTGIVTDFDDDTIYVRLTSNNEIVPVKRVTWEMFKPMVTTETTKDPKTKEKKTVTKIDYESIGEFIQFPLQLGYAMTIHKAQGKTLDKVIIDPDSGIFATGQAYVMLSRTCYRKDMYLETPLETTDIKVDKDVIDFLAKT